jgi:GNAT superfamily N-acetyltransferase
MNLAEILPLFDREQRQEVMYPGILRREVTPYVIRHIQANPKHGTSMVIYSRLTAAKADEVIRSEVAYFESIGRDFEWKVYDHDTPSDLRERLQAFGFEIGEQEAVMVLDLNEAPDVLLQPVTHDVRRITDPTQIEDIASVQQQVWPDKDFSAWLAHELGRNLRETPEHISIYAAYADGQPVSSAWITYHQGSQFAGLWGGATLPDYRQRGIYTALVSARLQEARQRGVRFLTIDASPMSRPIVQKHGFKFLTNTYPCKWRGRRSPADAA